MARTLGQGAGLTRRRCETRAAMLALAAYLTPAALGAQSPPGSAGIAVGLTVGRFPTRTAGLISDAGVSDPSLRVVTVPGAALARFPARGIGIRATVDPSGVGLHSEDSGPWSVGDGAPLRLPGAVAALLGAEPSRTPFGTSPAALLVVLAPAAWRPLAGQDTCTVGTPIPAYAHNDYENPRPLFDALALGYQGVEADVHLVRGALLVAHDRHEARPDRTLESLYLAPLRAWVDRCGTLLPGGRSFLLNIEAKTEGYAAYRAMTAVLRRYRDILTVVRDGREIPGPVLVVLVGWYPPLGELAAEPERLAAVQWYADDPHGVPDAPAHLIRMISLDYGHLSTWEGRGAPPPDLRAMMTRLVAARDAVPGRRARVHAAPVSLPVYRFLLDAGADLVGTKDLTTTRALLGTR